MRNTYNKQFNVNKNNEIDPDYHVGLAVLLLHSFIISLQLAFVVSYLILMLYFVNQSILFNDINQQIQVAISIILWLVCIVLILSSVSKQLTSIYISNFLFLATYGFSVLPTTQLIINILQYLNNGFLSVAPFVLSIFLVNIVFVTVIIFFLSRMKMSNLKIKILFTVLIIFCAGVSYVNMLF